MDSSALIDRYAAGPQLLRAAIQGLSRDQSLARPIPGKWSTLEVVCHIADFEIVGADRIQRVAAEDGPLLPNADENRFASRLAYHSRELEAELQLIGAVRAHITRILRTLADGDFARVGHHTAAGALTLTQLVERGANHIEHHVKFIEEKRRALGLT
jgi:hypothetical protein